MFSWGIRILKLKFMVLANLMDVNNGIEIIYFLWPQKHDPGEIKLLEGPRLQDTMKPI